MPPPWIEHGAFRSSVWRSPSWAKAALKSVRFFHNINQAFSKVNLDWNRVDFGIELEIAGFKLKVDFKRYGYFNFQLPHTVIKSGTPSPNWQMDHGSSQFYWPDIWVNSYNIPFGPMRLQYRRESEQAAGCHIGWQ